MGKKRQSPGRIKTWQEALDYVKTLNTGGYSDWRLPNRKELFSLIDRSTVWPGFARRPSFSECAVRRLLVVHDSIPTILPLRVVRRYVEWLRGLLQVSPSTATTCGQYVPDRTFPDISVTPNPVPFGSVNTGVHFGPDSDHKERWKCELGCWRYYATRSALQQDTGQLLRANHCSQFNMHSEISFAPTTSGNFSINSNIPSNDLDENPVTVSLNGVGVAESITIPNILTGPISGTTGVSYSYTTGGSTSSFGHTVEFQFDWKGDGTELSPWGTATQSKIWASAGTYNVRARARCTLDTSVVSGWSGSIQVTIASSRSARTLPLLLYSLSRQ